MRQDTKLMLGMTLLFFITFIVFGTIVTTEKLARFFTHRIKQKFEINLKEELVKDLGNAVVTPGFIDLFPQLQYTNINTAKPKSFKNKVKKFL